MKITLKVTVQALDHHSVPVLNEIKADAEFDTDYMTLTFKDSLKFDRYEGKEMLWITALMINKAVVRIRPSQDIHARSGDQLTLDVPLSFRII